MGQKGSKRVQKGSKKPEFSVFVKNGKKRALTARNVIFGSKRGQKGGQKGSKNGDFWGFLRNWGFLKKAKFYQLFRKIEIFEKKFFL